MRETGRVFCNSGRRSFEPVAALKTGTRAKPSIARTSTHIYIVAFDSYLFMDFILFVSLS